MKVESTVNLFNFVKWSASRCCNRLALINIIGLCVIIAIYSNYMGISKHLPSTKFWTINDAYINENIVENLGDRYVIYTPGCSIQTIKIWDPSIDKYLKKNSPPNCTKFPRDLLIQQTPNGHLIINKTALKVIMKPYKKGKKTPKFICEKKAIYRNQVEKSDKKNYRISDKIVSFTKSTPMDTEYAEVQCTIDNVCVYHNYFYNVIRKPEVENQCAKNSKTFLKINPLCVEQERLSVLVIGLDSVSRTNLIRQMPNMSNFLKNKLHAIDMYGYNRVGLNTYPSLIPYLTGNSSDELLKSCLKDGYFYDNCTLIWDIFENAGYRTAFVENLDRHGLFTLNKGGSHRQLAHYYSHTVYLPMNQYNTLKNGCWRDETDDAQLLKWSYRFQKEFANSLHFGHFWASRFAHDSFNKIQHLETTLTQTFENMITDNLLNKTVLVFMSDHGLRLGKFRLTEIGRQEENLPFMYLIFPRWFHKEFPAAVDNVRKNQNRLITTFDLHETLMAILKCEYATLKSNSNVRPGKHRGISLFNPISNNRNCDDAGIPSVFCACQRPIVQLSNSSDEAQLLSALLVSQLNSFTHSVRNICETFTLKTIMSIKKYCLPTFNHSSAKHSKGIVFHSHILTIEVEPSGAIFEATIEYVVHNSSYTVNRNVRRLNRYGNTSYCVTDGFLKPFCYCNQHLNE